MSEHTDRIASIAANLGLFVLPDQVVQLSARNIGGKRMVNRFFRGSELSDMAAQALRWEGEGAHTLYITLNPLRPDAADSKRFANGDDVIGRRWVMVDCEAVAHANGESATEEERVAAWQVLDRARGILSSAGFAGEVVCDSGNGWHGFWPVDLPNDEPSKAAVKVLLKGLAERCSDEQARVDPATFQALQHAKVYGCLNRKGEHTDERPWRYTRVIEGAAPTPELAAANTASLARLLALWQREEDRQKGPRRQALNGQQKEAARLELYAKAALNAEAAKVASAQPGTRNRQLNESAFAAGQLVGAGWVTRLLAEEALGNAARTAGLPDAEARGTLRRGLEAGIKQPRPAPELNGHQANGSATAHVEPETVELILPQAAPPPEKKLLTIDDVANIGDLIKAGAEVSWFWEGWIQTGVLTAIAAEGGTGKTRFCADLLRRIRHGLPWPDAKPMHLPADLRSLWVVADNHHDELATLAVDFGIADTLWVNAPKADPYAGVSLETPEDLHEFEARIAAVRPGVVIIDTVGNSTDKNLCRQEDAKAYYFPLQVIARKYKIALLCLTHLNTGGKFLGKRVLEKVRVAIQMEHPNQGDDRRSLKVHKTNSKKPPPLGVKMSDQGNDYDNNPPKAPEEGSPQPEVSERQAECCEWLRRRLAHGKARVSVVRTEAETEGYSSKTIYRARDMLKVVEQEIEGRKWWSLAPTQDQAFV